MALRTRDQYPPLVRAFLARFFENEITRGTDDLRTSFFWLIAVLAVPGIAIPLLMSFDWSLTGLVYGGEALRVQSRGDKAFYLGFAMAATGVVAAIAWSSLLPDRRDALILGAMPVRPTTIVVGRLLALAAYIALVAVAMHAAGSLFFGFGLATGSGFVFLLRGIASHFLVSLAASAFVLLGVTAIQGITLALSGPRRFAAVSPLLQVGIVGSVVAGFLALPAIDVSVVDTLGGSGRHVAPWILSTPPLWFLGMYEWMLGTTDPALRRLAATAALWFAGVLAATLAAYPIAYRRVMTAAVDQVPGGRWTGGWRHVTALLTALAGRTPQARGVAQFYLATLARADRHRFVLALAIGAAAAWALPSWLALLRAPPSAPRLDLLSLPIATVAFVLAALRVAASLPADLAPAWLFDAAAPSPAVVRRTVERLFFALGVLPVTIAFAPFYTWLWGAEVAGAHSVVVAAVGVLLIELLVGRVALVPCSQPWDPDSARVGRTWPKYIVAFLFFTLGVPRLEMLLFGRPVGLIVLTTTILASAALVRFAALREPTLPVVPWEPAPGDVLGLN